MFNRIGNRLLGCFPCRGITTHARMTRLMRGQTVEYVRSHKRYFPQCSVCGSTEHLEAHHVIPFAVLRDDFVYITFGEVEITERVFRQYCRNPDLRQKWQNYHRAYAELETMCRDCHRHEHLLGR